MHENQYAVRPTENAEEDGEEGQVRWQRGVEDLGPGLPAPG